MSDSSRQAPRSDGGEHPGQLELKSGDLSQSAADHLLTLTARAVQAPIAMVHLLDGKQLRLIGSYGLPAHWAAVPAVPIASTLGGLVILAGQPLVIDDAACDPRVPADWAGHSVGERAYVGFPIRDVAGDVVGVCGVLDPQPRRWQAAQIAAVDEGARACAAFVGEQQSAAGADRARRLLAALLDSLRTGVAACDADGRLVFANAANQQLNGPLPDQVDLRAWARQRLAQDPPASLPPAALPLLRALDGEHLDAVEVVVERLPERPSVLLADAQPITDAVGESLGAVVTLHDVTRQHSSALLKDCELSVRRILSGSDTGPVDELLTEAIATVGQTLGWAATEFWAIDEISNVLRRQLSWTDAVHVEPRDVPDQLRYGQGMPGRAWQTSEAVWAIDLSTDADARVQSHDWGNLRSAVTVPVPIGSVTRGVLCCYSTYTERADDARTVVMTGIAAYIGQFLERRRAGTLTAELDSSRDEYIALVGHEIRTPLTSIGAYTDLMLHDADQPVADRLTMLQVVQRNVAGLHTIIDKLLDIAGMQAGRITMDAQTMDLSALVRTAVATARTDGRGRNLDLDLDVPDQAVLWGDPQRLGQVVDELLANALAWADDASRITVTVTATGPITVLTISNIGQVIPPAERDRLFDRFFRTEGARLHAIPGIGLGLSLARTIAELHGGTITATSDEEPAGTTFAVCLPTQPPAPTPR